MAITISNVRLSYCNLFQPQQKQGQEKPKYSVTILLPKTNTAAKAQIDQAIAQAIEQGPAKAWNGVRPPQPAICIHDGDGARPSDGMPFGDECKGCWVFTASSPKPPFVVDGQVQPIIDATQVYSGCWGNVNVHFFPYNANGKKGIGCALNGVQKIRDDEPLDGRITAQEAFLAIGTPATGPYGAAMPATPGAAGYVPGVPATPGAAAYTQGLQYDLITGAMIGG